MPRKYSTWAPSKPSRAVADPGKMGAEVVPFVGPAGDLPRLGLFVFQVQALVAGEEIDAGQFVQPPAGRGLHEVDCRADRVDDLAIVVGRRRVVDEIDVPELGMVQVGKTAVDQPANEVDRQRRAVIAFQEIGGPRGPLFGGEAGPIDQGAAVAGQRDAVAGFGLGRAGLGILPRKTPQADHPLAAAVDEHEAHLQQHLEVAGDDRGLAIVEALGAVAPLEQESFAARGLGKLLLEGFDFPACHQRRQSGQFRQHASQGVGIGIGNPLLQRLAAPGVG